MTFAATNTPIRQKAIAAKSAAALSEMMAQLRSVFVRKPHPHYYQTEMQDRLERAQQDANRVWMYGHSF